ncbi:hypothetical protein PFAG_04155 [Plasmodium falciparum Santa Lucia]|uniref:Uncharacterized protein n=2 Tax=Plasmodium falciparum TaxID=5833 RepID=W7G1B2_PLAFA|nr:hypothetical protein PFNF135_04309 [Plasmodium falciparum NF135/5.C10]EUT81974.1 hypothetical protein PFAG_04155 [Plasmodium falciparum Santa Lucia]
MNINKIIKLVVENFEKKKNIMSEKFWSAFITLYEIFELFELCEFFEYFNNFHLCFFNIIII